MTAPVVKWLLNELNDTLTLIDSAATAEKSRVAAIRTEAAKRFEKCYQHFTYIQKNRNLKFAPNYSDHPELVVLVAEIAFKTGFESLSREVIEDYFDERPDKGAFYCRARQLMGLILNFEASKSNGSESIELRKKALSEVMESLSVAQNTKNMEVRYAFIVYNTSVTCWQIVRPFLREGRGKYFVDEVSKVSAALEKVDDVDMNWRIRYLSAAAVCFTDDGKGKEASDALDKAIVHAEKLLGITVDKGKVIAEELAECTKVSEEFMNAMREVEDREEQLAKPPKIDPDLPEGEQEVPKAELPPLEGLAAKGYQELKQSLDDAQKSKAAAEGKMKDVVEARTKEEDTLCKLYMQRVHSLPGDAKKVQGLPLVAASPRMRTLINLQCMMSGCIPDKDWQATFDAIFKDLTAQPQSNGVIETLLDVSRVADRLRLVDLARQFEAEADKSNAVSPEIRVKSDLVKAVKIVTEISSESANQKTGQRLSSKAKEGYGISRRVEALKLLERTLAMCLARLHDNPLVEEICVAIWNTGLPLCTPHLREHVHTAFGMATDALERTLSTLVVLRAQLHLELSKCEERADFVVKAKEEGVKALLTDYGGVEEGKKSPHLDRNRHLDHLINPYVEVLQLRSDLYGSPQDPESQASLMLQSIKESNSKLFQKDTLDKAAALLFGALDREEEEAGDGEGGGGVGDGEEKGGEEAPPKRPTRLGQDGEVTQMPVADVEAMLSVDRGANFAAFNEDVQRRVFILASVAQIAHSQRNVQVTQWAAQRVLREMWDPSDPFVRPLLDRQVDMHFLLADCLVERLAGLWIEPEQEDAFAAREEAAAEGEVVPNPRTLGVQSEFASEDIATAKRLVCLALQKAVEVCLSTEDQYGLQNAVIYFWNLHLPLFRNRLYGFVTDEVEAFLKASLETMQRIEEKAKTPSVSSPGALDGKLKANIVEAVGLVSEAKGNVPAALEVVNKGAADTAISVYARRKLSELAGRLAVTQAPGKSSEPPKLDHPVLAVYHLLAQSEAPEEKMPSTEAAAAVDKAVGVMRGDLQAWIDGQDWAEMSLDDYNEVMEMRAECWCRLTRGKIASGDIYGSQDTAEQCMQLVSEEVMQKADEKRLSPRVWRWLAICERYFGMAIQGIISPDGMDKALQDELSLAALRHFNISCGYSQRAGKEELLVEAAVSAWNASMHLIDSPGVRHSLQLLQRQVLESLLTVREENMEAAALKQQFYVALIECISFDGDWDAALEVVLEAFENVPAKLQKPLWKWRVVALSKKGKNVLDGIQKLKEGDPSLQARVYGILARASADPKQQLEAYRKTIEILGEDIERVDYELETAQWMASAGVPRIEIVEVVQGALDCLYEVEDKHLIDAKAEGSQALNDAASAHSSHSSHSSSTARSKATGRGNKSASNSRRNSRAGSTQGRGVSRAGGSKRSSRGSSSRAGSAAEEEEDEGGMPADLHAKQLEQAVRSLSMLAMLSSVDLTREERANEAVYFVRRFFGTWAGALKESAKQSAYWKLTPAERDETPLEAFQGPAEAVSGLDFPIDDAVAMLRWAPSETFQAAQQAALEFQPADVPTPKSMPSLPLTLHYCLWLAGCLEQYGYSKHALLVLAFARCLFMMVDVDNALSALAVLQFKAMGVLARCGLHELIPTLPASLGASEVSCEAFVAGFGSKLIDPVGVKAKEHIASEHMSVFGFSSWTQALDGVDPSACALELCRELLSLGQTSQCLAVAEGVRRDFIVKRDARGLACISSVLAELHMIGGRVGDVLATVLAQMENLESVGDATELWNHVRLAVQAYRRSARGAEAKRVCLDAVATLAEFCSIAIAKEPPRAGTAGTGMPVSASSSVASGQPSVTSNNRRTSVHTHVESSIETTAALRDAVHTYVDLLVAEAQETAGRSQTLGETYLQVRERLSRLEELATSVCGSNSVLVASVCEKRGVACAALLDAMHGASSVPGKGADEYPAWLEEQYAEANGYLRRCTDIRRGLLSRITFEEQSFLPLVAPPAQQAEEEVPDPKAKKGKGAEPEPEPEPKQAAMALLSVPMARDTAFAELHLARQSLVLARLRGDQLTALPPPPTEDPTVIEQYLESTQPPVPFKGEDFRAPDIMLAASTASSAAQLLSGTEHAREGELLCAVSGVMRWCGSGAFDKAWVAPPERKKPAAEDVPAEGEQAAAESESEPGANEGVAPAAPEFDERAVLARAALVDVCAASLGGQLDGEVAMAAVALVDAFGNLHGGAREAAPWLLLSQSLRAKEWLMSTWRAALNPACEVSAAVQRLDSLEASRLPSKEALPQILAEQTFLRAASPSWRRLEVTEDPAAILQRMPARTALLSLQICPSNKAIYACAGLPEPVEGEATPYVAGGKWVVDKMPLGEPERRLLLTLVQQQRKWKEDAAKFVAVYGENVSPDQDLAGVESAQAGKLGKVERALEERLRAVLADMELALQPLLGPDSVLGAFLRSLLAPELAEDGTVAPTQPEPLSLLLLVDPSLQELPWEGHSSVAGFCGRVGRDFSLHLLGHRLSSHTDVVVRSSSLSTVFDPFGDDTGSKIEGYERPSIGEVTRALSETVLGAGSWASLKGTPGLLTLQDWITCTQLPAPVPDAKGNVAPASKVSVFLFAPGRMGSLLSPSELASMDMGSVLMLQAVDQGLSDAAFRRQNTLDNTKRPSDIAKEDALNMAALASLAGAGCVNTHLWATTLAAQRRFVNGFWDSFGQGGSSLAAMSAASLLIPPQSEGEEAAAAPAPKSLKPWVYLARIAYGLPHNLRSLG
jgi:hypothetical protein